MRQSEISRFRAASASLAMVLLFGSGIAQASEQTTKWKPYYPSLPLHQDFGGPFELTDHLGNTFTQDNLKGHYSLLYFGYTSCPEICALTLHTISMSLDEIAAPDTVLTPYFVNLDPKRDSLVNLAEYLGYFHQDLVGLTGTAEQVRVAAGIYTQRYKQVLGDEGDRKTVHSGMIFLLGPSGQAVAMLPHDVPQDWLTATLREHLSSDPTSSRVGQ